MIYQMIEYQTLVNRLRMCRADLEEKVIVKETQKTALRAGAPKDIFPILKTRINLAVQGFNDAMGKVKCKS